MVTEATEAIHGADGFASQRALARAAGVSHSHLALVYRGARELTPEVAEGLAAALEGWAKRCATSAKAIRAEAKKALTRRAAAKRAAGAAWRNLGAKRGTG